MKKLAALLLCLMLLTTAMAEIAWPASLTSGQAHLRSYVEDVNLTLTQLGGGTIDMQYELYSTFASMGMNGADTPETVEMYFLLGDAGLHSLTLRICDADQFELVAASCLASSSAAISVDSARELTAKYADVMRKDRANPDAMTHSFEEDVIDLQGSQPRAYFAYYPNQYGDGKSWLQMTLIFARPGSEDAGLGLADATPAPNTDEEYEGYFSQDNYTHLEVFVTPTPEPDSAAMER
ncbi:MAG: hypothetical protein E7318_08690 [Clostridiales bacterium]|nr:hypothetical protein [Clostridiales bacterium]